MKKSKTQTINMVLSAFLVVAYVLCSAFFQNLIVTRVKDKNLFYVLYFLILIVFGLLLFYATRCGEGKQVKRFSLPVLLLMVVPGLYIVLAYFAPGLPLNSFITGSEMLSWLGAIMLGYGIPYTFLAGYERDDGDAGEEDKENADEDASGAAAQSTLDLEAIKADAEELDAAEQQAAEAALLDEAEELLDAPAAESALGEEPAMETDESEEKAD